MSISWWGRARERGPGGPSGGTIATFVMALLLASFATGTWSLGTPPEPLVGPSTPDQLQALLDIYRRDLADKNQSAFELNVDPARPALVKCARERFRFAEQWLAELGPPRLLEVEERGKDYVRAVVLERRGIAGYYFRRAGVFWVRSKAPFNIIGASFRWYVSEPPTADVGEERLATVEGVEVAYREIDSNLVDAVGRAAAEALAFARSRAATPIRAPLAVRVYPNHDLATDASSCHALARYDPASRELRVYEVLLDAGGGAARALRAALVHEALHRLQEETLPGASRVPEWWLVEGWPDVVAGLERARALVGEECRRESFPSLGELARDPDLPSHDLVAPRRWAYASAAVRYLLERYGEAAYWKLLGALRDGGRDAAYHLALGVGAAEFHANWVAWARGKYCVGG